MVRHARLVPVVCLAAAVLLAFASLSVSAGTQAGKTIPADAILSARTGACAASLPGGRVLMTGGLSGQDAVADAETFGPGGLTVVPPMLYARSGHACAALPDGKVLVAGGRSSGGALNIAEIYDPAANEWRLVDSLREARADAAAAALPDGRVLIVGGESAGVPVATLEIYDPLAARFTEAGVRLAAARSRHAVAALRDGSVLIAGGWNGTAAVDTMELYEPATGRIQAAGRMLAARSGLTATRLLDGRILLAGGNNGSADLASAELFDGRTNATVEAAKMPSGRSRHLAFALPGNNQVMIAGGSENTTPLLYVPWRDEFRNARSLIVRQSRAVRMKAGSVRMADTAAATDTFPTIQTDKLDYMPGEVVSISGAYWTPGHAVNLVVKEVVNGVETDTIRWQTGPDPLTAPPVAKDDGTITLANAIPITDADVGKTFALRATEDGTNREASVWTFTDSVTSVTITSPTKTVPVTVTSLPKVVTVAFDYVTSPTGATTATAEVLGTSVSASKSVAAGTHSETILVTIPSGTANAAYNVKVTVSNSTGSGANNGNDNQQGAVVVQVPADTTPPVITPSISGTLGQNGWYTSDVNLSWTVTDAESAISSQTGCSSVSITSDTTATGTTFTCSATSAGGTASKSVTIKRDATPPVLTPTLVPAAPASTGWYNIATGAPTVTFTCSDAASGLASACPASYTFPEGQNQSHSVTITDNAGNSTTAGPSGVNVDLTAPVLTASINPATPAATGWYNIATGAPTVSFTCVETGSGLNGSCPSAYTFPDGANQSYKKTVTDIAGNTSSEAGVSGINVDLTPPTIAAALTPAGPASTGWYNISTGAPTLTFTCSDATSGLSASCPVPYKFPEGANQTHSETITDKAGNSASAGTTSPVNVDLTAPVLKATVTPSAPAGGWYNKESGAPTVSFTCDDTISGVSGTCPTNYTFPDGKDQSYMKTIKDVAGNESTEAGASGINVDTTPPVITATLSPDPDTTGWYNLKTGAPKLTFTCSDATSGLAGECPAPYTFGEGANQFHSATITDQAGNTASAGNKTAVNVDLTAPVLKADLSPASPAGTGWYNASTGAPTLTFTCTESGSGLSGACPGNYTFPDGANQSHMQTVKDVAGNESNSAGASGINVDVTPPTITGSRSPDANANGWNNQDVTVTFVCSDATSDLAAGSPPNPIVVTNEGADQSREGSCYDKAGNRASATVNGINIDKTAPTAQAAALPVANSYGWNNTSVTVNFSGEDGLSGIAQCSTAIVLATEGANQSASGTCTDKAGNVSAAAVKSGINIDLTQPSVTATPDRAPNAYGWYTGQVTVTFAGTDSLSGIASCSLPVTLAGEGVAQSASGGCTDKAGNVASATVSGINIDNTAPVVSAVATGTQGSGDWYTSDVKVTWTVADPLSGIADAQGCAETTLTSDTSGTVVTCSATNKAGLSTVVSTTIKIDKTPPKIVFAPDPVQVNSTVLLNATVTDATSGVASVTFSVDGGASVTVDSGSAGVYSTSTLPSFTSTGVYNVCVTAVDKAGLTTQPQCAFLPVYDPNGGFVTGGGWIDSPAGAYTVDPTLTGKANFGFVSKYQKGTTVPTGNTEFQFKAGNLNFKSTSYDWLVVAGAKAQFKGSGTINGTGAYGFILTAIDGQLNGGGGVDKFRIKIQDKTSGTVVYDNQLGVSDTADPTTAISGGSIVVHSK